MIQHETRNNHGNSGVESLPIGMLALTPLYSGEYFSDVNGEMGGVYGSAQGGTSVPMPFFTFGDSDDDEDDMEEDDFDDMEEEEFDDDEDDFDDDDDDEDEDDDDEDDDDDFDEDEDDDYDYDEDDDFEYDEE